MLEDFEESEVFTNSLGTKIFLLLFAATIVAILLWGTLHFL